jgi:hypothetical protein
LNTEVYSARRRHLGVMLYCENSRCLMVRQQHRSPSSNVYSPVSGCDPPRVASPISSIIIIIIIIIMSGVARPRPRPRPRPRHARAIHFRRFRSESSVQYISGQMPEREMLGG